MSHQFKPGDLALTLAPLPSVPVGSCVELELLVNPGDVFLTPDGMKTTILEYRWVVIRDSRRFSYHERELMPLRGDFEPDQQKAKEAEPCL